MPGDPPPFDAPPASGRRAPAPAPGGRLRLWAYVGILAVLAAALGWAGAALEPAEQPVQLPWLLLLALFFGADLAVVHLRIGRGSRSFASFTLSELPLVLGLVLADPLALVSARVLGGVLALVVQRTRDPAKFSYNAAAVAVEATLAVALYRLALGGGDPLEPLGWAAVFGVIALVNVVGTLGFWAALWLAEGRWVAERMPRVLALNVIAGITSTGIGLLAMLVVAADLRAGALLVLVAGLTVVAYRRYSTLLESHEALATLHDFTQQIGSQLASGTPTEPLLREATALVRAERAEMVLLGGGRDQQPVVLRYDVATGRVVSGPAELSAQAREVLATGEPLLVPRGPRSADAQALLAAHGVQDLVMVPLTGRRGIIGVLTLGGRLGGMQGYTEQDIALCQTVANHASVLLENGRLVDRLREEVAEKEHQASHDALTGLPNRAMFHRRVEAAVEDALRDGTHVAVMLLDLDRFKEVNDTLGHHVGDDLLQEVGARLRRTLQPLDTVARLGGDEFAILLPSVPDEPTAATVAERARHALEQPFQVGHLTLVIGASFGIALAPDHGEVASMLLQRADVAMYAAKDAHAGVMVYSPDDDTHSPRRLALVGDLRHALERDGLTVHYQPKAEAGTGAVTGVEALVRWFHPTQGSVSPDEFIPIAERTGMIHELTALVLRKSLAQCREWRVSGRRIDVAVNLSVGSLLNLDFPDEVGRLLREAGVAAGALTLEITEGSIMADPSRSIRVLSALSLMGVQLAIDDFGTGYSSLSQLKQLPVDEIKIDKSFILNMTSDDDDATIVRSTIDLGHNLALRVVAEGVDDQETWRRLRALGCDVVQGFYLSRALDPRAFDRWLAEWERGPERTIQAPVDERLLNLGILPPPADPYGSDQAR